MRFCVAIFAIENDFYTEDNLKILKDYFIFHNIEFDIYRNGDLVGYHKVSFFEKDNNTKEIISDLAFQVKILGIEAYNYKSYAIEIYQNDKLISFKSDTNDDGDNDHCYIKLLSNDYYDFDGSTEGKVYKYTSNT